MLKFSEVFESIINDRLEVAFITIKERNYLDYNGLTEQSGALYQKIKMLLPREHAHLIGEYEEMLSREQAIMENVVYKQGLKDGMDLKKAFNI